MAVSTQLQFGQDIYKEAQDLAAQGKDANQIAGILFGRDPEGANYGIGIILNGQGKPLSSSSTLLKQAQKEVSQSTEGNYFNTNRLNKDCLEAVLRWQRIPETYWKNFKLILPSDAGTGAVQTAIQISKMINPNTKALAVEKLGWPAYKALAKTSGLELEEIEANEAVQSKTEQPLYQAGPMNSTGQVRPNKTISERAQAALKNNQWLILDRAYSGFEFARELGSKPYSDVMKESYQLQLAPFLENKVPFMIALSPTKAFVTFSLRPCGLLLVYCPDEEKEKQVSPFLNMAIRARGSSFEHPITRAFVKALVNDRSKLEGEHEAALKRLAESEKTWRELTQGTSIESYFTNDYAGLFRNLKAKDTAAVHLYNEHIYPVLANGRCRLNITGIPNDLELAKKHVSLFAEHCL